LINNAGLMSQRHHDLPLDSVQKLQEAFWSEDPQKWAAQFDVNVTSAFFTTVAFMDLLVKSNQHWLEVHPDKSVPRQLSNVITVTGIAAHHRAMPAFAGYAASKAAVLHLMKTLSTTLAPHGIRFVCIAILTLEALIANKITEYDFARK
jgi:NAD(P)-dependent dehydrogenase (short-subunit alcohol dehydrogenase family)